MARKSRWDEAKAVSNRLKHGVTFHEAQAALKNDPFAHIIPDEEHSIEENRYLAIARSCSGRYFAIVYTIRNDTEWLISARLATVKERRRYMKDDRIREATALATQETRTTPKPGERITAAIDIDDDVALFYSLNDTVEYALRTLIAEGRAPEPGAPIVPPASAMDLDDWGPEEFDFEGKTPIPNHWTPPADTTVFIDGQLLRWFIDGEAINDALRTLIAEGRVPPKHND